MNTVADIDPTRLGAIVRKWWHQDNSHLRVVAFHLVESEARHLPRLYSLLVISQLDALGAHEACHLYRHSKKKSWEPVHIEYGRRSNQGGPPPEFINRKRYEQFPTEDEVKDFLVATEWNLGSGFTILRDTGLIRC